MWYADFLVNVAHRFDEAVEEVRRALALDPQNSFYQVRVAVALLDAHRDDEAIALLEQTLKNDPNRRQAAINLGFAYGLNGMYDKAFALMQQNNANNPAVAEAQRKAYAEGGYLRAVRVRADTLVQQSQRTYVSPGGIGNAYARAGEKQLALDWLEKAFEERETMMVNLGGARGFEILRGEPRFQALLRGMNLAR
jgi:tetratricopeptide (TPR) repeat protein